MTDDDVFSLMLSSTAFRLHGIRSIVSKNVLRQRNAVRPLRLRPGAGDPASLFETSTRDFSSSSKQAPMPITVLSGFLGAGKTTFLHHLLNNQKGLKFGLVVNDMASVNIDAKQVKSQTLQTMDGIDTMELQNGCVCCSLSEDLIASIARLVTMADENKSNYNHIVVECSGIAEPRRIRDFFQEAENSHLEFTDRVRLDTLITLVDASAFYRLFGSDQEIAEHRELAFHPDQKDENASNTVDSNEGRKITELLLEQVECADIVLINKCDLLASPMEVALVEKVIAKINPKAKVYTCTRGEVSDPLSLVASAKGQGAVSLGIVDELKVLVKSVEDEEKLAQQQVHIHHAHNHTPKYGHEQEISPECDTPTSTVHSHEHGHVHAEEETHACAGTSCTHPSHVVHKQEDHACSGSSCTHPSHEQVAHSHDHGHGHEHEHACAESNCTHPSHTHDHDHTHTSPAAHDCSGQGCDHPSHSSAHDATHSHDHNHDATTAETRFGITSFVYKRRRPFHPVRFSGFLRSMGKLSIRGIDSLQATAMANTTVKEEDKKFVQMKQSLLRSKGFVWMAVSKSAGFFLSHAGQYLEIALIGRWWADMPTSEWPQKVDVQGDFEGPHGDRRQEIVFIGQFGKEFQATKEAFEKTLDVCLLTDEEMKVYEETANTRGDEGLQSLYYPPESVDAGEDDEDDEEDTPTK